MQSHQPQGFLWFVCVLNSVRTPKAWAKISQQGEWSGRAAELCEAHRAANAATPRPAVGGKQNAVCNRSAVAPAAQRLLGLGEAWRPGRKARQAWWPGSVGGRRNRARTPADPPARRTARAFQQGAGS